MRIPRASLGCIPSAHPCCASACASPRIPGCIGHLHRNHAFTVCIGVRIVVHGRAWHMRPLDFSSFNFFVVQFLDAGGISCATPCLMALESCLCASMVSWRAVTGRCMWPTGAMAFDTWMAFVCDSMSDGFGSLPVRFHGLWVAMTGRCMWPAGAMSFNFWTALVCDGFGGLPVRVASTATWSAMIGRCMRPACALSSGDLEGMMVKFDACG